MAPKAFVPLASTLSLTVLPVTVRLPEFVMPAPSVADWPSSTTRPERVTVSPVPMVNTVPFLVPSTAPEAVAGHCVITSDPKPAGTVTWSSMTPATSMVSPDAASLTAWEIVAHGLAGAVQSLAVSVPPCATQRVVAAAAAPCTPKTRPETRETTDEVTSVTTRRPRLPLTPTSEDLLAYRMGRPVPSTGARSGSIMARNATVGKALVLGAHEARGASLVDQDELVASVQWLSA